MNKQELIEKYKSYEGKWGAPGAELARQIFIEDLKLLDEPEKVKIPQFVAEYIEQKKDDDYHLLGAMIEIRSHKNKEIDEWFYTDDNIELFARAWLDGYEVEKEPKYTVKIKSTKCSTTSLVFSESTGAWFFSVTTYQGVRFKHTRKQLEEANFGWVFDCEGIEIVVLRDLNY